MEALKQFVTSNPLVTIVCLSVVMLMIGALLHVMHRQKLQEWELRDMRAQLTYISKSRSASEPLKAAELPCVYAGEVRLLHGFKPIVPGSNGKLQARWVDRAMDHSKTCERCKTLVAHLQGERFHQLDVQELESACNDEGTDL